MKIGPLGVYIILQQILRQKMDYDKMVREFSRMTHCTDLAVAASSAHTQGLFYCFIAKIDNNFMTHERFIEYFIKSVTVGRFFRDKRDPDSKVAIVDDIDDRLQSLSTLSFILPKTTPEEVINMYGRGSCYVYNSLPFSYAFFLRNPTDIESLYDVVSAGGDTDSNGSIVGSLLGALNGTKIFPQHLIDGLWQKDRILDTAERFCDTFNIPE